MRERNETYARHGCYGTNIVLASQLYSSSSADTLEGTSDLKTLLEFYQQK